MQAYSNQKETIEIRILEKVNYKFDNYNRDMQRIASRENYYIDKYQEVGQCLHQRPEGSFILESIWNSKKENEN